MRPEFGYIGFGLLLIMMTMITASLKRLPLTAAIIYLCFGFILGPSGIGLLHLDPAGEARALEHLTEVALIVSLFTAGLKLRLPLNAPEWRVPFLLASLSMLMTILLIALTGVLLFSMPLGAALLLGAILAPTDPVLAASVQVLGPEDRDMLRFSLTAEAGLNDGTAFPFVMLGLGILEHRELGAWGWRWILEDVFWATVGGLALGALLATGVGRLVTYLRRKHEETQSLDDFLALGLVSITYGIALWLRISGFLAVFAAGIALRRGERRETQSMDLLEGEDEPRALSETTSARMAHGVLAFNEQLERLGEIVVVLVLGTMISVRTFSWKFLCLAGAIFFLIRPVSVMIGTAVGVPKHRRLLSWFGIRGIGSLYYVVYVMRQGISAPLSAELTNATFFVITASILVHGITSAPLMMRDARRKSGVVA
jgi:NhaP-type Na+/H+ or K+/H+ antiporter